jgi:glutamate/tyrosine decarboxylase-like PLP-dependent enzyme
VRRVDEFDFDAPIERAVAHTRDWLASLRERPVTPARTAQELVARFDTPLPETGLPGGEVVDALAERVGPGLVGMPGGRFFGLVIGGTHPAALAADWLVSAWDQNALLRGLTPGVATAEQEAGRWLLDLLGLPAESTVGFATGATMANFTGLAAARSAVLARAGWDLEADGLSGAPRVRVVVGRERHESVDLALRYLGLGRPLVVDADEQGRIDPGALHRELAGAQAPTIVCLQAGNLHSGAFDPFGEAIAAARRHGAWVHVDGAFGLWAAASPALEHLTAAVAGADSWATDAHKTLNVPYDCGIAIVADPGAARTAMGMRSSYLMPDPAGDPHEGVPELSRRARGVPVWAALRSLGRSGVADLVERLAARAAELAEGIRRIDGAEVLNDVVWSQASVSFGSDDRTREVTRRLLDSGEAWMSGSRWRDRAVLRVSVSNWSTDDSDIRRTLAALADAARVSS